jgi:dipeptidyl aminopeptidase/acylaminoacyl peptidase
VTDLLSAAAQRHPASTVNQDSAESYESRLLGSPVQTAPEAARFASPITYVHVDSPPVQIHHGDADLMVPYAQSVALVAALEDAEVSVEFVTLPGADHFWIGAPDIAAIFNASLAFAKHITSGTVAE